ncbi:MAG TPA: DUF2177 family protein [Candidatus Woesebacteria bacterium]|nr:DUF2177 family protein [Candidatus Woesebacteria bacterium]
MLGILQYIKIYLFSLPVYLLIDGLWLTVIAKGFYAKHLGFLMTDKPNWVAAGIFYLSYVVGLIIFAVAPALKDNSLMRAVVLGGLFGMFCYATYDLTNLATVKGFPWFVAVIDIIWGISVSVFMAIVGFAIGQKVR